MSPATRPEEADPRVRRTRRMLQEALAGLLDTENFEKISVSDIAQRATLNRATFYAHYPDKFALLECLVGSRFEELLAKRNVVFDGCCHQAIHGIILAMCDYLADLPSMACSSRAQEGKYFESALIAVVREMLLAGLRTHPPAEPATAELLAGTLSGAIYGGAHEWLRTLNYGSAEEVAYAIFELIRPMLK